MNNKMKRKKSGIVISVILFLFSAVSLIYGIYMVRYSLSYVNTYTGMSAVPADKVMQYVVSASSIYFGFGILFAACAFIILFLSGTSRKAADSEPADVDEHPENNPYYTAPADAVHTDEAARPDAGIAEIPAQPETDIPDVPRQAGPDTHENQIWQEAELHQVAAFEEHAGPSHHEDLPHDTEPELTEAFQQDAATAHTEESPQQDAIPAEAEASQQDVAPADHEYHIRPELASDSWLKDAFIKK